MIVPVRPTNRSDVSTHALSKCCTPCQHAIGQLHVRRARSEQPRASSTSSATWLESLGFKTTVRPLPDKPGKANLIATLGEGSGGTRARRTHRHRPVRRLALVAESVRADRARRTPLRPRHVRHERLLPDRDRSGAAVRRRRAQSAADDRGDLRRRVVDGRRARARRCRHSAGALRDHRRTDRLQADLRAQRLHDAVDRAAGRRPDIRPIPTSAATRSMRCTA